MKPEEKPNLCDCGRHLPCRHRESKLCENCYLEPATIQGTHADAGPIKVCKTCAHGQYWPHGWKEIPVERAETPVEQRQIVSEGGDSAQGLEAARSEIQGLFARILFVYAKSGKLRCFSADELRGREPELKQDGWTHTATLDPARWIEAMANGCTDLSDMLDELLTTKK